MLKAIKQPGFTLVELLVAITIAGILLSLASKSYSAWVQNQQIRNAAESILNGLQVARSEAVNSNSNVRFVLCSLPASSWEILAASPGAPVPAVSTACGGGSNAGAIAGLTEIRVQEKSANEGAPNVLVVVTPAGTTTVTFNGMGRVVGNADASAPFTLVALTNPPVATRPLSVSQTSGGSSRMCDPSPTLAASDPRHC